MDFSVSGMMKYLAALLASLLFVGCDAPEELPVFVNEVISEEAPDDQESEEEEEEEEEEETNDKRNKLGRAKIPENEIEMCWTGMGLKKKKLYKVCVVPGIGLSGVVKGMKKLAPAKAGVYDYILACDDPADIGDRCDFVMPGLDDAGDVAVGGDDGDQWDDPSMGDVDPLDDPPNAGGMNGGGMNGTPTPSVGGSMSLPDPPFQ